MTVLDKRLEPTEPDRPDEPTEPDESGQSGGPGASDGPESAADGAVTPEPGARAEAGASQHH
ncbi:iron ABC transporter permease, partial [Streptomyces ipomoeae]|nr:iron ABC transporter permease [Streptomyces ipomoeae]